MLPENLSYVGKYITACPSMWQTIRLWTLCTINISHFFLYLKESFSGFSLFIIINTKETITSTKRLLTVFLYTKNKKIWRCNVTCNFVHSLFTTFNFQHGSHVALFKTLNFMVLFCFTSSEQSEMVGWLYRESLVIDTMYILDWK